MTDPQAISSPLELSQITQQLLENRELEKALKVVGIVDEKFPREPIALHLAGIVWERAFLEYAALGKNPSLIYYEKAAQYFERALQLDAEQFALHAERLYTCLFVLGTQKSDLNRLRRSEQLALELVQTTDELLAENYRQELAIIKSGIARITQELPDWEHAGEAFDAIECPESGREKYFHCYYKGIVKRSLAEFHQDQQYLLEAIAAFRSALGEARLRSVLYLLADCLVQLEKPDAIDRSEMREYIPELVRNSPQDTLVQSLEARWHLRLKLLGEPLPSTNATDLPEPLPDFPLDDTP